ncbi:hypothetical protein D0869_10980 [Hortaea werneckii]|uniref:Uncharacterized protein n=1 Tax=Hortaea werneckii TaxID=91943 RepID=A0A3M6WCD6_HORWE|nr:hypothetical protein KC324_g3804 [Hortaea werneckii]KAI7588410.1 hypothetical protein KC316_g4480 [Hortaea werneckii]RMX76149.1 hypothetical protein D0869_10980 [Hortaea werneckii]RMX97095.1 hypothetical protein D0868_10829 [Hortaea werneckii]
MAPNRRINFSQALWKEILPVSGFVYVLFCTQGELKDAQWFSEIGILYVWAAMWFTLSLLSLRCLYGHGPFYVAGSGWMQNLLTLWDLYKKTNGTEASLQLADIVYAGIFTVVAVGLNSYILANRVRIDYSLALPAEDESREAEKA